MDADAENLLAAVHGLGEKSTDNEGQEIFVKGKECIECLQEIRICLRGQDPETRDVFRLLGQWNVFSILINIVTGYRDNSALVVATAKVIVTLTLPVPSNSSMVGQQLSYQQQFKSQFLARDVVAVFATFLAEPLGRDGDERTPEDDQIVELFLTLFRNLLLIPDPVASSSCPLANHMFQLQQELIKQLEREHVLEMLVMVASEPSAWTGLLLEMVLLLLRADSASALFAVAADAGALHEALPAVDADAGADAGADADADANEDFDADGSRGRHRSQPRSTAAQQQQQQQRELEEVRMQRATLQRLGAAEMTQQRRARRILAARSGAMFATPDAPVAAAASGSSSSSAVGVGDPAVRLRFRLINDAGVGSDLAPAPALTPVAAATAAATFASGGSGAQRERAVSLVLFRFAREFLRSAYSQVMGQMGRDLRAGAGSGVRVLDSDRHNYVWLVRFFTAFLLCELDVPPAPAAEADAGGGAAGDAQPTPAAFLDVAPIGATMSHEAFTYIIERMQEHALGKAWSLLIVAVGALSEMLNVLFEMGAPRVVGVTPAQRKRQLHQQRLSGAAVARLVYNPALFLDQTIELSKLYRPTSHPKELMEALVSLNHVTLKLLEGSGAAGTTLLVRKRRRARRKQRQQRAEAAAAASTSAFASSAAADDAAAGASASRSKGTDKDKDYSMDPIAEIKAAVAAELAQGGSGGGVDTGSEDHSGVDDAKVDESAAHRNNDEDATSAEISLRRAKSSASVAAADVDPAGAGDEDDMEEDQEILDAADEVVFNLDSFVARFEDNSIIHNYMMLLRHYASNSPLINHAIVKVFYRVAVVAKMPAYFYLASSLHLLHCISRDPLAKERTDVGEASHFARLVSRRFFNKLDSMRRDRASTPALAPSAALLAVEALFYRRRDVHLLLADSASYLERNRDLLPLPPAADEDDSKLSDGNSSDGSDRNGRASPKRAVKRATPSEDPDSDSGSDGAGGGGGGGGVGVAVDDSGKRGAKPPKRRTTARTTPTAARWQWKAGHALAASSSRDGILKSLFVRYKADTELVFSKIAAELSLVSGRTPFTAATAGGAAAATATTAAAATTVPASAAQCMGRLVMMKAVPRALITLHRDLLASVCEQDPVALAAAATASDPGAVGGDGAGATLASRKSQLVRGGAARGGRVRPGSDLNGKGGRQSRGDDSDSEDASSDSSSSSGSSIDSDNSSADYDVSKASQDSSKVPRATALPAQRAERVKELVTLLLRDADDGGIALEWLLEQVQHAVEARTTSTADSPFLCDAPPASSTTRSVRFRQLQQELGIEKLPSGEWVLTEDMPLALLKQLPALLRLPARPMPAAAVTHLRPSSAEAAAARRPLDDLVSSDVNPPKRRRLLPAQRATSESASADRAPSDGGGLAESLVFSDTAEKQPPSLLAESERLKFASNVRKRRQVAPDEDE